MDKDVVVFHAGTKIDPQTGNTLTDGGRVLTVTTLYLSARRKFIKISGRYNLRDVITE